MTGVDIWRIPPDELSENDVRHLQAMLAVEYNGYEIKDFAGPLLMGNMQAWRISGAAEGIMLTQLIIHPGKKELLVWGIAGVDIAIHIRKIIDYLQMFGAEHGADYISAISQDVQFTHVLADRVGAEKAGTLMRLEIENV